MSETPEQPRTRLDAFTSSAYERAVIERLDLILVELRTIAAAQMCQMKAGAAVTLASRTRPSQAPELPSIEPRRPE